MVNKNNLTGLIILAIFLLSSGYQLQNLFTVPDNGTTKMNNRSPVGTANNQVLNTNHPSNVVESNPNTLNQISIESEQKKPGNSQQNNNVQTISNSKSSTSSTNQVNSIVQGVNDSLWYNDDWSYRENITVNSNLFTQSETNFPIYLDFYDKNLKLALNSGYDILFTDASNHKLPYERITFDKNYNATYTHLVVWLKGNFTNTATTTIMMYFGNPFSSDQSNSKATWSNGYQAVYHLNSVSTKIVDSTGTFNGTTTMTSSSSTTGIDGSGIYFSGTNTINLGNIASDSWTGLTIEAWVNRPSSDTSSSNTILAKQNSTTTAWSMGTSYQNKNFLNLISKVYPDGGSSTSNILSGVAQSTWNFVALTWSSNSGLQYLYSVTSTVSSLSVITTGTSILNSNANVSLGSAFGASSGFIGGIDEIRISNVARTSAWLQDSRNQELNYKNYFTVVSTYQKIDLGRNWTFNQLQYRKNITINHNSIPSTLTNYPFLITLQDSSLFNYAQTSGNDILFTDVNGTRLEQETEQYVKGYDSTSTSYLVVWLKIPVLSSSSNTTIYMYYGNSTVTRYDKSFNIWSNYSAVWHLADTTGKDSSGNGYTGQSYGSTTTTGSIGYGQAFNGNSLINTTSTTLSNSTSGSIMLTGWFKLNSAFSSSSSKTQLIMAKYLDTNNNFQIALAGTDYTGTGGSSNAGALVTKTESGGNYYYTYTTQKSWNAGVWYQFVIIFNPGSYQSSTIYINGMSNTGLSYNNICILSCNLYLNYNAPWSLGGGRVSTSDISSGNAYFNGSLDELRIANVNPGSSLINFTYVEEKNPSSIYSVSGATYFDFSPPVIQSYGVTDPGTGTPTFWAKITDKSTISKAYISINNTVYPLTYNNTPSFYVYQFNPNVTYGATYSYKVLYAIDIYGNNQTTATFLKYFLANYVKPTISITYANYNANEGGNGTFVAQVTDTWPGIKQVTVTVQCTATCPSPNYANMTFNNTSGYYESVFDFIMGQSITFNITAYDLVGNKITSQLFSGVVNNRPPKITSYYLYSSYTNTTIYSNESLLLHYSYSDPENEPDNSLIYWYKNNTLQSAYNNLKSIPTTAFKKGDTWYASIIPYDGYVYGNTVNTTTITIQNTPPTVSTSLMSVMSSQNLTASFSFSDYDNDRTNYTIWWYKNGSLVSSLNNKSYVSPSFIKRGEYWYFRIGVSDGTNTTYKNSNGVYIKDTPPVLTGSPGFTINNVTNIQDLIVNYTGLYYDYDGDPENISSISPLIRWYINGTYNSSFDNQLIIYGNSSHPINSLYYYIIYVYDGYNYSLGYKSIPNYEGGYTDKYAPQISNLYFANSFNQTCDNNCTSHDSIGIYYHYQDNDTPSNPEFGSTYLWYLYVNGIPVLQSQYTNMKILPNGTFIHGEIWYVIVTPCDGSLNGTSVQSGNLTIIDIIPYISTGSIQILASNGTFINEQNTTTDENLYANWIAVDGDNDSLQFEIKWYENNSLISNYQNATLIPSNMTRKGETWIFSIRAWDGFYWSNWKNFSISIIDSPPTISHFVLVGGENKTIPISISFLFSDPDNDTNNSIIIWYVNGQPVSGPTNITMFSAFNAGDQVYVVVKSYDGQLFGNIITSLKITIGDAIPISSKPYIYYGNNITSTFFANDTLYVNFTASDADGNYCSGSTCYGLLPFPYSANYRWYLNNTLQPSLNSYFVPSQYLKKGDIWTVSIQPIDRALGAGLWYNCTITIIDAPPTISAFSWSDNYPTTQTDLQISFSTSDIDGDSVQTIITWYVNDTMVLNGSSYILNTNYFIKNKIVKVQINVTDGQNSSIYLKSIKILNTPPTINSISIDKGQNIYANDSLSLSFNYYDADMDPNASTIIRWFMIYRGITYSEIALNNQFSINSSYTVKDEVWYASIQVYDGQNYSIIYYTANYLILDSAPYISSLSINNNLNINKTTFTNTTLYATYLPKDNDVGDTVIAVNIIWYLNGVYNSTFNNMTSINPIYTKKGETWYYIISIFDGTDWSGSYTSETVQIQDSAPIYTNFGFIFSSTNVNSTVSRNFYLTDDNITITYTFHDIDNDPNESIIYWFRNGILVPKLTNMTTIPSSYLVANDTWFAELILSDGQIRDPSINSSIIYIVQEPKLDSLNLAIPNSTTLDEGWYDFTLQSNDSQNLINSVTVIFNPTIQNSSAVQSFINSMSSQSFNILSHQNGLWTRQDYDFFSSTNRTIFASLIGNTIAITIQFTFIVKDKISGKSFLVTESRTFYYTFVDLTPPRVIVSPNSVQFNDPNNPTLVEFNFTVTDYGSGIKNVTVFYYFAPSTGSGTTTSLSYKIMNVYGIPGEYKSVQLFASSTKPTLYTASVPFNANESIKVLYYVVVFDNNNNANTNAVPAGQSSTGALSFKYSPPGLPIQLVALAIGIILLIALIGTFVGIRKFRKTEIVGLDVEKVMSEAMKIPDYQVQALLNTHSLGVVLSTFHQTQGPLPFYALPTILTDNLEKLIDLSDRSFSAVRFVDNFTTEMQISFDYTISSSIKVSSVSYGFSLNRPSLRGGSDNITFNILVHKPYDVIINQFINQLDPYIHEIHTILDTDEENKELIEKKTDFIRNLISKIIVAYQNLYPDENINDLIDQME